MKLAGLIGLMLGATGVSGVAAAQAPYALDVQVETIEANVKSTSELRTTITLDAASFAALEQNQKLPFKVSFSEDAQGLITAAFTVCHPAKAGCEAVSRPVLSFPRGAYASSVLRGPELNVRIDLRPTAETTD